MTDTLKPSKNNIDPMQLINQAHQYYPDAGVLEKIGLSEGDWKELRYSAGAKGDLAAQPDLYGTPIYMEAWLPYGVALLENHRAELRMIRIRRP